MAKFNMNLFLEGKTKKVDSEDRPLYKVKGSDLEITLGLMVHTISQNEWEFEFDGETYKTSEEFYSAYNKSQDTKSFSAYLS